ncbi:MAG: hypothetical protein AAFY60_07750, partial [Myxococcota bacterium]
AACDVYCEDVAAEFGLAAADYADPLSEKTFAWDGTTWVDQNATGPVARFFHGGAYSPDLGRSVLFGGTNSTGDFF